MHWRNLWIDLLQDLLIYKIFSSFLAQVKVTLKQNIFGAEALLVGESLEYYCSLRHRD